MIIDEFLVVIQYIVSSVPGKFLIIIIFVL